MTQKELLYVEDAIGHEQNTMKILQESINMLEDRNLVTFLKKELKRHSAFKEELIELLEDQINE